MLLSLLLAVVALPQPAEAAPTRLVVGTLTHPVTLEPHRATDTLGAQIVANVCETLVRMRPGSLRPEGVLATAWATPDQRTWTFTLREGVHFHDGTPFDADAVVGNLGHLRRERAFAGTAERVGPHVVQINLERANAALLSTLSQPYFAIQSPRALEGPKSHLPVGTGPFRLVDPGPNRVVLEAFPGHWQGAPRLGQVVFRRFGDEDALERALVSGAVDVSSAVGQGRVANLRAREEIRLDSRSGLNLAYLALNNEHPPFHDPRVRVAVDLAMDRSSIVNEILRGHGEPADTPLPPGLFPPDARARTRPFDRDRARRMLARAGVVREDLATTITVSASPRPYLPEPRRLAEIVREALAEIGLQTRIREVATWSEHVAITSRGDFDLALLGWEADTLDPNDFLTALLDSGSIGTTNRSRYFSDEMDGLLRRARGERARHVRDALYRRAQALFQEEMPFVPLYHASVFTARRREVQGLVVGPTGILFYGKAWKAE